MALLVKKLLASAGDTRDLGSVPRSGGSTGGVHGNPLHIHTWGIPWIREPGWLHSIELQTVGHD